MRTPHRTRRSGHHARKVRFIVRAEENSAENLGSENRCSVSQRSAWTVVLRVGVLSVWRRVRIMHSGTQARASNAPGTTYICIVKCAQRRRRRRGARATRSSSQTVQVKVCVQFIFGRETVESNG